MELIIRIWLWLLLVCFLFTLLLVALAAMSVVFGRIARAILKEKLRQINWKNERDGRDVP